MRLRLIAPPAMQEGQWVDRPELLTESCNLGKEYKGLPKRLGIALQMPVDGKSRQFTMEFILEEGHRIFAENIRKNKYLRMISEKKDNGKDLITGFLGSGKTTFIKKYARYLMEQGQNIGILENDFEPSMWI